MKLRTSFAQQDWKKAIEFNQDQKMKNIAYDLSEKLLKQEIKAPHVLALETGRRFRLAGIGINQTNWQKFLDLVSEIVDQVEDKMDAETYKWIKFE